MKHGLGGPLGWEEDDDEDDEDDEEVAVVCGRIVNCACPCDDEYPAFPTDA